MELTRRRFIQLTGSACVGMAFGGLGFDLRPIDAHAREFKLEHARESKTICPYCSVGCGAIVHTRLNGDQRTINIEGDPENVINRGSLCSKVPPCTSLLKMKIARPNPCTAHPIQRNGKWLPGIGPLIK